MALLDAVDWTGKIFNGEWVPAQGGKLASIEPATGEQLGEVGLATAQRLPHGVVGVISPWNFPQILSVRAVAHTIRVVSSA